MLSAQGVPWSSGTIVSNPEAGVIKLIGYRDDWQKLQAMKCKYVCSLSYAFGSGRLQKSRDAAENPVCAENSV